MTDDDLTPIGPEGRSGRVATKGQRNNLEENATVPKRQNALFTHAQRKFLWRSPPPNSAARESELRGEIEHRLVETFRDFMLLSLFPDDKRTDAFDTLGRAQLKDSLASLVRFVYLGTDRDQEFLESTVERAVWGAELAETTPIGPYHGGVKNVDVEINVDRYEDPEEIYQRYERDPDDLTPGEIGILVRVGKIEPEDLEQLALDPEEKVPDFV